MDDDVTPTVKFMQTLISHQYRVQAAYELTIIQVRRQWLMGFKTNIKYPNPSKGICIELFIPVKKNNVVFVAKSFEKWIRNNIHYFTLDITYFRFIHHLFSFPEIRNENGIIYVALQRNPRASESVMSNISSVLNDNAAREFDFVNKIQSLCARFPSLMVHGHYDSVVESAKIIRLYVLRFTFASLIHLSVYEIIAILNQSRAYLELKNHYQSIKSYVVAEKMIMRFQTEDMPTMDERAGEVEKVLLQQQLYLDVLIKKDLKHRQLDYVSPRDRIVATQKRMYLKSYRTLRLRKGRNLSDTLNRLVPKKCVQCHGIKANGRNRKCKCERVFYCSKRCQKIHWKYAHNSVCPRKKC